MGCRNPDEVDIPSSSLAVLEEGQALSLGEEGCPVRLLKAPTAHIGKEVCFGEEKG